MAFSKHRGRLALTALLGTSLTLAQCSTRELLWGAAVPGAETPATVTGVAQRGEYLDAWLESDLFQLRFLFPDGAPCRQLLEAGSEVSYVRLRQFGVVKRGEERCEPIGIAALAAWRDLRPRGRGRQPIPRAQATFRAFYADEEVVLVRGRFPLAGEIGLAGGRDLVAMLPNLLECQRPLEQGVASMEFFPAGRVAFALVGSAGRCPILGFALPLPD